MDIRPLESKHKTALVTGANRGIGYEIARQLAEAGNRVTGTCRVEAAGEEARSRAASQGVDLSFVVADVTDRASLDAIDGEFDILVNNAGIALDKWVSAMEVSPDTVRATMEVNFIGVLNACQRFLPAMKNRGYGRIVNLSSQLGSLGSMTGMTLAYRSSKSALNALTRVLAAECEGEGDLLINSLCPGWVKTELGGMDADRTPEEAADTAIWLATLPEGGPNGGFFQDRKPLEW